MGDTEDTVASQPTEVIDVDKNKEEQQPRDVEKESKKRKTMALILDAWNHFAKVKLAGGEEKAKCKYCEHLYKCGAKTNEYRIMYSPSDKVQTPTDSQEPASKSKSLMRSIIDQQMSSNGGGNVIVKSELEKYFSEDNEEDKKGFDILKWWKANERRLPVLSCMARDLLAMPISTIASESAFSTGGRILDDFRSSLTPIMVERPICASDWIHGSDYISVEENTKELTKLEEGKGEG